MSSLPTETWDTIIKYLRLDKKSLKSIRAVCQGLHALATPLLYSTIRVPSSNDQYGFIATSRAPNLASVVKRIEFYNGAATPQFHGFPRNDPAVLDCLYVLLTDCKKDFHNYTAIQEQLCDDSWSRVGIQNQKLLQWGPDPFHIAKSVSFNLQGGRNMNMSIFPRLESVETSSAIFLQGPRFAFLGSTTLASCECAVPRSIPKSVAVLVPVANIMEAWVARIELTKLWEVLYPYQTHGLLPNLAHLTIDLSETDCWDEELFRHVEYSTYNVLALWLQDLNGFRSLVIRQNPRLTPAIDIVAMIRITQAPPGLRSIELDHVTIREDSVIYLVHEHLLTLEHVSITDPVIEVLRWDYAQNYLEQYSAYGYEFDLSREPYKPDDVSRQSWERDFCTRGRLIPHI